MGIWRNIGKIVILSGEIIYQQVKWYVDPWKRVQRGKYNDRRKGSDTKTKSDIIGI